MARKSALSIPDVSRMTQLSVASVLGMTRQAVAGWDCPRNRDNTYDLRAVVQWRLAVVESQSSTPEDAKSTKELRRLRQLQGDKVEMELAVSRGELVRVADVDREWGLVLSRLRMHLVHLPNMIRAGLDPTSANTVIPVIEREVKSALDAVVAETETEGEA
jgi:phage terminase Nu1 subunit (DNA packaging protein)